MSSTNPQSKPLPEGMSSVIPHLVCAGAAQAIDFYKQAFDAQEVTRLPGKDGKLMHAMIRINGAPVMLTDEAPQWGALGPNALKGTPVTIHLYVDDVDATFERALSAGATSRMPVQDMFWGDRYGVVVDPFGHHWSLATHVRDVSPEELRAAAQSMC